MRGLRHRAWLLSLGVLCVPLAAAAVAYGCTAAATLTPSSAATAAGQTVSVTGKYFGTHDPEDINSNSPVQIRLGSVTGPVLASAKPTGTDRSFTVNITVPAGTPAGNTFLSGTQLSATGTPVYGTPARQAFKVLPAPAAPPARGNRPTPPQLVNPPIATLSMATARRLARARVKRSKPAAKNIRAKCARRSPTTAMCRAKYRLKSKTRTSKRFVVKAPTF
jgi:hypothetical protein